MNEMVQYAKLLWKHLPVLSIVLGSLLILVLQMPIPQDTAYHQFADTRVILGIPNFQNVISNLPFVLVGMAGVFFCFRQDYYDTKFAWLLFFSGISLVGIGSIYYHLNPSSNTLLWDRLPMAMGFMALFAGLLGELIDAKLTRHLLLPMIMIGFASVMVWHWFDDLRFYVWVQFMPMSVIPIMLLLYRKRYSHTSLLCLALLIYMLAKVLEVFDMQIFSHLQNAIGGHAMKHVVAAAGSGVLLWMLSVRKPLSHVSRESMAFGNIRYPSV